MPSWLCRALPLERFDQARQGSEIVQIILGRARIANQKPRATRAHCGRNAQRFVRQLV
jgi:hypothetical protein